MHILEVLHGELTFPYRNMQQNPEPDRPRWAIPFTVTDGRAVLPPPPEQQAQTRDARAAAAGRAGRDARPSPASASRSSVRGEGFEPGKTYALNWTRVVGNRMTGRAGRRCAQVIAEAKADAARPRRIHASRCPTISAARTVCGSTGRRAKKIGTFWIKPTALPLDVRRGPVGTEFRSI